MLDSAGIICDVCGKDERAQDYVGQKEINAQFNGLMHDRGWKIVNLPPSGRETHCPDCLGNEDEEHF